MAYSGPMRVLVELDSGDQALVKRVFNHSGWEYADQVHIGIVE